jgi:hypothetical protein
VAVLCLWSLVAGLSQRRPGFELGSFHVRFMVDIVALGQGFLRVILFTTTHSLGAGRITWHNLSTGKWTTHPQISLGKSSQVKAN